VDQVRADQPAQDLLRTKTIREIGDGLMGHASDLGATAAAKVQEAMGNITDPRAQAVIANVKKSADVVSKWTSDNAKALRTWSADKLATTGVKKSEDYSGAHAAIRQSILPILQKARPDLFELGLPEQGLQDAARVVRMVLDHVNKEGATPMSDAKMAVVVHMFGDATGDVLKTAQEALHGGKPENQALYEALNRGREILSRDKGLKDTLNKSLVEPNSLDQDHLDQHVALLRAWAGRSARGERASNKASDKASDLYHDSVIQDLLDQHYGKNQDAVLKAVEKDRKATHKGKNQFDDGSTTVDGEDLHTDAVEAATKPEDVVDLVDKAADANRKPLEGNPIFRGVGGRDEMLLPHPDVAVGKGGHESATHQAMAALAKKYPDRPEPTFMRTSELGDHKAVALTRAHLEKTYLSEHPEATHADVVKAVRAQMKDMGLAVVHGTRQETAMTEKDIPGLRLQEKGDPSAFLNNPARVDIGGNVLDGIKLTKWAEARNKGVDNFTEADNKSASHRTARMFMEGLAAAQDHLGKVVKDIPDSTQIGWRSDGKKPLTWGEVKGLDYTPHESAEAVRINKAIAALRDGISETKQSGMRSIAEQLSDLRDQLVLLDQPEITKTSDGIGVHGKDYSANRTAEIKEMYDKIAAAETRVNSFMNDGKLGAAERAKSREILGFMEKKLQRLLRDDAASVGGQKDTYKKERDPFGNVLEAVRGKGEATVTVENQNPKQTNAEKIAGVKVESDAENISGAEIRTNLTGNSREADAGLGERPARPDAGRKEGMMSDATAQLLKDKFTALRDNQVSASAKAVAERGLGLMEHVDKLNPAAHRALVGLLAKGKRPSDVADVVNSLTGKVEATTVEPKVSAAEARAQKRSDVKIWGTNELTSDEVEASLSRSAANEGRLHVDRRLPPEVNVKPDQAARDAKLTDMLVKEDYSALTTPAKTNAFLKRAYQRYGELMANGEKKWKDPAFGKLADMFDPGATEDLASYHSDFDGHRGNGKTSDQIRAELKAAAPEVAANLPKGVVESDAPRIPRAGSDREAAVRAGPDAERQLDQANYTATLKKYGEVGTKFDKTNTDPNTSNTAALAVPMREHIDKVLGPQVAVAFKGITHAGEFGKNGADPFINVSVHALDPMSTLHHESLHGFFDALKTQHNEEVVHLLERVSTSSPIVNQLKRLLKDHPEALKQLDSAEETAAYMYQFWSKRGADGQRLLQVGDRTDTFFRRIAVGIRNMLGIWSNDRRALEIMDYFDQGKFAKNLNQPHQVMMDTMYSGRNLAFDAMKRTTKPLREISASIAMPGSQKMRESGIPALARISDLIKPHNTAEAVDNGYFAAAGAEHRRVMNDLAGKLRGFTDRQMREALDAMQAGVKATSKEARQIQIIVQNPTVGVLAKTFNYMGEAGVDVGKVTPDPTYFHRMWDSGFIAAHQKEFLHMLEKYQISGQYKGDPKDWMNNLVTHEGMEFNIETNRPGMQALKNRRLDFITGEDAAPFLRKDLYDNLNSYVQQATRRAEWARRFGDNSEGLNALLEQAKKQGATPQQLAMADHFIKGADGTLGDTLDPKYRRLFGNLIVYQNIRLLPLGIFSSMPDSLGIMVQGGSARDTFHTFVRGLKEIKKNFQAEGGVNDAATNMAEAIGTIENAYLMRTLGTSYSQGMVGNWGRRVNDTFFRFNWMDQYNRSMRVGATQAALHFVAKHADGTFNEHSARWMREIGYEPGEMKITDGMPDITDPKVRAALNRWVDRSVLRPDATDVPTWFNDPHYALVSHLKKFTYAFQEVILKRVLHEARNGNYKPAMVLSSYVPMMLAADAARGIIQGGGSSPDYKAGWDMWDYLGHAMQRAGLFGAGQFGVDVGMGIHEGGTGVGALSGPTLGQMWEALEVMGGKGEQPGTFMLHATPANAAFTGFLKNSSGGSAAEAGPNFSD